MHVYEVIISFLEATPSWIKGYVVVTIGLGFVALFFELVQRGSAVYFAELVIDIIVFPIIALLAIFRDEYRERLLDANKKFLNGEYSPGCF